MTHQRLSPLLLLPLFLVACGSGDGRASNFDPDTDPPISDQQPPPSGSQPPISDPSPPDYTQPPGGTSTPGTGGGGGGSCENICRKLLNSQCEIDRSTDCAAACDELRAEDCPSERLALIDCVYSLGFCPDAIDGTNAQQIAAACSAQVDDYNQCADPNGGGR